MSLRKAVPDGLKPQEVERNSTHKAPCPYIPEQDEVEAKLELKTQYAKFTQPNGVELKHPVYDGVGNREKFLTHTSSALEAVEEMGIKKEYDACMADVEQAKNAVEQAKSRWKDAKDFLKTVKEVDSDGRKTAEQEVIAAKTALDKAKEDRDSARAKPEGVAEKAFDTFGMLLNQAERATWSRIVKKHTEDVPWTDLQGEEHEERCGKSWESLRDCIFKYLKTQFADDAADVQRYYVMNTIKKSAKVGIRPFVDRVQTLNRYIGMLPGLYNSPQAVAGTKEAKPFDEHDLANLILRMCPREWETQWKLSQKTVPQTVTELVEVLETIEEAYNAKRAQEKSKGSSDGKRKNGHMSSPNDRIPKKAKPSEKPSKKCKLCEKLGGKPLTHYTNECKKYNPDGTVKKDFGRGSSNGGKDTKREKAHFAQMKKEYQEMKRERKHLKKLNKKLAKKAKKRAYESDSSDSDAS